MKVVCAFVPGMLHPLCKAALNAHAPMAQFFELGRHRDAYYSLFTELWGQGEGWLNVEQDIEIHSGVVEQAQDCREPWCVWPYKGANGGLLDHSLGCTRFSDGLLRNQPRFMEDLGIYNWQIMDAQIHPLLLTLGYEAHIHEPVQHHHDYGPTAGGCACGGVHT